jgi:hypothetical protein
VCRAETAREDGDVLLERLLDGPLELLGSVADDDDLCGLYSEVH